MLLQLLVVIAGWSPLVAWRWHSLVLFVSRSPIAALIFMLSTVLMLGIAYAIYRGRNWARILYLGLWLLGLLTAIVHLALPIDRPYFLDSPMRVLLFSVRTGVSGIALVLLFSRASNIWFSPLSQFKERTEQLPSPQC